MIGAGVRAFVSIVRSHLKLFDTPPICLKGVEIFAVYILPPAHVSFENITGPLDIRIIVFSALVPNLRCMPNLFVGWFDFEIRAHAITPLDARSDGFRFALVFL